jgi:ABC-type Fe3+-hydroxamate transport system substrate-binding protein
MRRRLRNLATQNERVRIISLVPSMTETLLAWGIEPLACTRFCEQPGLRHVGGTKDPEIDAIVDLRPDLVIVDAEENRVEDHDALVAAGVPVHALRIRSLDDVDVQLRSVADRLGVTWRPLEVEARPATTRAFIPIWRRPWMALGTPTYGSALLAALGVDNVFADNDAYPETTLADAAARHPAIVVAPSEPYPFGERHRAELASVAPPVFVDGRDLFWWGARTTAAASRLARVLAR